MNPLRQYLDKSRTAALFEAFIQATPELAACWLVDQQGRCFAGSADSDAPILHDVLTRLGRDQTTVKAPPYWGEPLIIEGEQLGFIIARGAGGPAADLRPVLRYLAIALRQAIALGQERRDIVDDALTKYREITLLYSFGETINAHLDPDEIADQTLATAAAFIPAEYSAVLLWQAERDSFSIRATPAGPAVSDIMACANRVRQSARAELANDAEAPLRSLLGVPLKTSETVLGVLVLANKRSGDFTAADEKLLLTLAAHVAVCLANAAHFQTIQRKTQAFQRFVPIEFLRRLGRDEAEQVTLGEASDEYMAVLFADLRAFTALSEKLSPADTFGFLNTYLARIGPLIERHGGFIDKYIGDAVMALFPGNQRGSADDALAAAVAIVRALRDFNRQRRQERLAPIGAGIGIHTGPLRLGTIGFEQRMDSTVIGDTVNLAARVERLTKRYGIDIAITGATRQQLTDPSAFALREVDRVQVHGRDQPVAIYDVFESNPDALRTIKQQTLPSYHEALDLYRQRHWRQALDVFQALRQQLSEDRVIATYVERCRSCLTEPPGADWTGITRLDEK